MAVVSPLAAWYAESQHRAQDFASAQRVAADSSVDGYIAVEGAPTVEQELNCPATSTTEQCLYVEEVLERYTRSETEQCGTLNTNAEVVRTLQDDCDSDGRNCKPCYSVAEYNWAEQDDQSKHSFSTFTVSGYTVVPTTDTTFFETQSLTAYETTNAETEPKVGDVRHVFTYLPTPQHVVVAGLSNDNKISTSGGKLFVVSGLTFEATQQTLADQDTAYAWHDVACWPANLLY